MLPTMQSWLANALLRAGLETERNTTIKFGVRRFPEYTTAPAPYFGDGSIVVNNLNPLFVPLGTSLVMSLIVSVIVSEKAGKQRALMLMMSMKMPYYWLAEWIYNSFVVTLINVLFFAVALLGNSKFMLRSPALILLILIVWGQCVIGMAVLLSCLFRRPGTASTGTTLLLFMLYLGGNTLNQMVFRGADDFPWYVALIAPFAYVRIVSLLISTTATIATMPPEVSRMLLMLVIDAIIYPLLGFYLDSVMPREFGVRSHPLFFLRPFRKLFRRMRGEKDEPIQQTTNHCTRKDVDTVEDDDVRTERELIEEEEKHPSRDRLKEVLIESRSLRKVYSGGKVAVRNLTMSVRVDECFGFLGPNGAGKTTAISCWTGLYEPTSGSAQICGYDIKTQMYEIYGRCGVCPQFDILWPLLTVREHLKFYAQLKGLPKSEWDAEAYRAARSVELTDSDKRQVHRLSGGMKRRVSFAISLIANPAVVFLDEPTTGLDPETKRHMWSLIDAAKPGRSIVLTTHSMEEADALSDRIGIMAYGSLRCIGSSLHLKAKFGTGHKVDLVMEDGKAIDAMAFMEKLLRSKGGNSSSESDKENSTSITSGSDGLQRTLPIPSNVNLSDLFEAMNSRPESAGIIQWALRQSSMEEVFLRIARESEAQKAVEDEEKKAKSKGMGLFGRRFKCCRVKPKSDWMGEEEAMENAVPIDHRTKDLQKGKKSVIA